MTVANIFDCILAIAYFILAVAYYKFLNTEGNRSKVAVACAICFGLTGVMYLLRAFMFIS